MVQNKKKQTNRKCQKFEIMNELDDTTETMRNIKFIATKIKKRNINRGLRSTDL